MNRQRLFAAVCAAAVLGGLGLAGAQVYDDYKAKTQHDLMVDDMHQFANVIKRDGITPRPGTIISDRITLPDDGYKWTTSICLHDNTNGNPRDVQLRRWFEQDPRLARLWSQTHHQWFTESNPNYRSRYASAVGGQLPAVVLCDASGMVVYKASGDNIPISSTVMADEIANAIAAVAGNDCPNCPKPNPPPQPSPLPAPTPGPVIPDIGPPNSAKPAGGDENAVLMGLGAAAAGMLAYTIAYGRRKLNFS